MNLSLFDDFLPFFLSRGNDLSLCNSLIAKEKPLIYKKNMNVSTIILLCSAYVKSALQYIANATLLVGSKFRLPAWILEKKMNSIKLEISSATLLKIFPGGS